MPPYVQAVGLTAQLGLIYATFLVVETLLKSPLGHLGDRVGRRAVLVCGALLSCCAALAMTRARSLPTILALRGLDGVAAAAIWPTLLAAVGGSVPAARRARAMSGWTAGYIAAVAIAPLVGGRANDLTGSKTASFYVVAALFGITAVMFFFIAPGRVETERRVRFSEMLAALRSMPEMGLLAFCAFFAIGLLIPVVKLFAMDELGLTETGYGVLILPVALAVALVSFAAGRLGDRWGKVRSVRLGVAVSVLAMWAVCFSARAWQFAAAGALLGMGFVFSMPAWLALVSEMADPCMRGGVIGALGTSQGVGAVIGAYLGSKLYVMLPIRVLGASFDAHHSPFVVSAVALSVSFVLAVVFLREHRPPLHEALAAEG
ncbi:MAG: MFS transporter [Armatimonadota bacterium]